MTWTSYRLKTIRLINFHNFVDAEIPVRGHLFLVGDNASGKTTVLDAVQWVLSGNQDMEFNAAARLWGKREEGRTLRGAVQRYDAEKGIQNKGRTIAYAAVELETEQEGLLTLGLGAELAHPNAQMDTWGFVYPGPLSEVPLLQSAADSQNAYRPITREELRAALGQEKVHYQISRYRKIIAARLTRGEADFKRLTEFWKISKAYRQMAHGTRDYSQLLRHMLPAPDDEVFREVSKGLTDLASLEDRLEGLHEQIHYLERLAQWMRDIDVQREAIARYQFLSVFKERQNLQTEKTTLTTSLQQVLNNQKELHNLLTRAREDVAAKDAAIQDLRRRDEEGLLERRTALVRDLDLARDSLQDRQKAVSSLKMEHARSAKQLARARQEFSKTLSQTLEKIKTAASASSASDILSMLNIPDQTVQHEHPEMMWEKWDARHVQTRVHSLQTEAGTRVQEFHGRCLSAQNQYNELARHLEELEKLTDPLPDLPGYAECLRFLSRENLQAAPLYKLLEKTPEADESLFRDLEALLSDRILGALVPDPVDAAETTRLVLKEFPGIPVVRTDLPLPHTTSWIEKIIQWPSLSPEVRSYLHRLAEEDSSPGLRVEGNGQVEDRGARLRVIPRTIPLMGEQARKNAHAMRIKKCQEQTSQAKGHLEQCRTEEKTLKERVNELEKLSLLTLELTGRDIQDLYRACLTARGQEDMIRERQARAKEDAEKTMRIVQDLTVALETLCQRLDQEGLQDLTKRLSEAENAKREAEKHKETLQERMGGLKEREEKTHEQLQELDSRFSEVQTLLSAHAEALRPLAPSLHQNDLERYALDIKQGRQFTKLENIRDRLREADRNMASVTAHLMGDGGVAHPHYGGLFGFQYDEGANRLFDRKNDPLEAILENFSAHVQENESLLDQQRRKLFQEIILGHLARRLQEQVSLLEDTIRGVNRQLGQRVFGRRTRYKIMVKHLPEHSRFISVLKQLAAFNPDTQEEFKYEVEQRLKALPPIGAALPPEFDYRYWFEFLLRMQTATEEGVVLEPRLARVGSGGEQAVPKYLIVLAMASLLFRMSESRLPVLLFDEVFYGIDQARREELLALATELDLQLLVASPEQAGDSEKYRRATTVFLVKDDNNDVHSVVHHIWTDAPRDLWGQTPTKLVPGEKL